MFFDSNQVEKPAPKDHEVLVKVYATTVHRGDVRIRSFGARGQIFTLGVS
jgi:NADPH:quinone reductase-like Zn-dependent oxidoreductase